MMQCYTQCDYQHNTSFRLEIKSTSCIVGNAILHDRALVVVMLSRWWSCGTHVGKYSVADVSFVEQTLRLELFRKRKVCYCNMRCPVRVRPWAANRPYV